MPIYVSDLEKNEIMSSYSPNVEQNNNSNCVMLELDNNVVNHARKVADKLNEIYHKEGGEKYPGGYIDLFGVLREMLDIQLEREWEEGIFEDEPVIPTDYGKHHQYARE